MDYVRVLRVIEYTGPRDRVEETVAASIHGQKDAGKGLVIRAATIGEYPEMLAISASGKVAPIIK